MAVPKKRNTKSRRDKKRGHLKLEKVDFLECPECGEKMRPHRVCPNCGYYKGEKRIKPKESPEKEVVEEEKEEKKKGLSWERLSRN